MRNLRIAVLLVTYNGIDDTCKCIESLKNSTLHIDIIVVDNASIENEAETIKKEYPEVITIRSQINGGFSYGNNLGIKWAITNGYEYVLLLNNDTVVDKEMILRLVEYASSSIITVPSMFYYSKPDTIWYGGGYINRWTGNAKHRRMSEKVNVDKLKLEKCTFATGCCMMINTDIFRKIGLLDEKFFMYSEDAEFCIRAIENNISIKYVPKAKLWHKVSSSTGGSDSPFSTYYMTRNRLLYIDIHKGFFKKTAKTFTITTRKIRAIMSNDNRIKEAFLRGIQDYKNGITGKVDI